MRTLSLVLIGAAAAGLALARAPQAASAGAAQGGGASLLVGIEPSGLASTTVRLITPAPFTTTAVLTLPAKLSAISRVPGLPIFSFTGGWDDGGNLYHIFSNGVFVKAGPTGYGAVPALAWDATGAALWGVTGSFGGGSLVSLAPETGAATLVGPTGLAGIQAMADHGPTGLLIATTGFFYDGSPGDVITIDKATGLGTDTGQDLLDAAGGPPPCLISGLSFSLDGAVGYASVGCGLWGQGAGTVYRFTPGTYVLTPLGVGTGGGSMSGLEVAF